MAIGTTAALVGGSLLSSAVGAKASKDAAKAGAASADAATRLQGQIYDETTQRFAPYLSAGNNALGAMLYEMGLGPKPMIGGTAPTIEEVKAPRNPNKVTGFKVGDKSFSTRSAAEEYANANKTGGTAYGGYTESPMAKYLMEKGTDSISGSAAASGGLFSGATLQALEDNRRKVISADTGDYFARLAGITNMGLGAAGNQASAGAGYADSASRSMMAGGAARADGYLGVGKAVQGGIADMAQIYGFMQGNNPMAAYTAPTLFGGNSWGR